MSEETKIDLHGWAQMMRLHSAVYMSDYPPSQWEIDRAQERGTVSVAVFVDYNAEFDGKLVDAVERLQGILNEVPEEKRAEARLEIESEYESSSISMTVSYNRLETDEEWATRRADVERRQALAVQTREAQERAEFERLRAKFAS